MDASLVPSITTSLRYLGFLLRQKLEGAVDAWNMQVVHLPQSPGADARERECLVKREPAPGCVMTAEAVGRRGKPRAAPV